jgi:hypothetical protein
MKTMMIKYHEDEKRWAYAYVGLCLKNMHTLLRGKEILSLTSSPDLCQNNRGLFEQRPHLNIISLNKTMCKTLNMKESLELDFKQ